MIPYLIALLVAVAVTGLVLLAAQLVPAEPELLRRLQTLPGGEGPAALERRRRQARSERLQQLLSALGSKIQGAPAGGQSSVERLLLGAGYVGPTAVPIYYGVKLAATIGIGALFFLFSPTIASALDLPRTLILVIGIWGAALGWVAPTFIVASRANRRKKDILRALPDALDLLVVCVEAGLGLNQAMQRVAEEISIISPALGEQLGLVNLEIRAGTPRDDALRNLANRTDLDDLRSLTAVLIQTERFGTSVAQALRIHADTLRTKRRQRVEEASAKTAIKMLFPLVFCIFPALFLVILGPGVLQALKVLGDM
ncbi:MAG: type II secretion system F family protein [Gemmatimonadota bacterium]|jgi:tight adherence protein C|nr:type II secretion system F family protein [Gemmatimonadota bacterium]